MILVFHLAFDASSSPQESKGWTGLNVILNNKQERPKGKQLFKQILTFGEGQSVTDLRCTAVVVFLGSKSDLIVRPSHGWTAPSTAMKGLLSYGPLDLVVFIFRLTRIRNCHLSV